MIGLVRNADSIKRARAMRHEPTSAEAMLWAILRSRRYRDIKFRRQHAIGPYVVDFACVGARLVIEVDGPSHEGEEQVAFDVQRTELLKRSGWRVVRIPNADVFAGGDAIYLHLDAALRD